MVHGYSNATAIHHRSHVNSHMAERQATALVQMDELVYDSSQASSRISVAGMEDTAALRTKNGKKTESQREHRTENIITVQRKREKWRHSKSARFRFTHSLDSLHARWYVYTRREWVHIYYYICGAERPEICASLHRHHRTAIASVRTAHVRRTLGHLLYICDRKKMESRWDFDLWHRINQRNDGGISRNHPSVNDELRNASAASTAKEERQYTCILYYILIDI